MRNASPENFSGYSLIGVLPGIAEVHVMTDRDHDAPVVVPDGPPLGNVAIFLIRYAAADVLFAWDLKLLVDVVKDVIDLVAILEILDGTIRQHLPHAGHKMFPVLGAVEVID